MSHEIESLKQAEKAKLFEDQPTPFFIDKNRRTWLAFMLVTFGLLALFSSFHFGLGWWFFILLSPWWWIGRGCRRRGGC